MSQTWLISLTSLNSSSIAKRVEPWRCIWAFLHLNNHFEMHDGDTFVVGLGLNVGLKSFFNHSTYQTNQKAGPSPSSTQTVFPTEKSHSSLGGRASRRVMDSSQNSAAAAAVAGGGNGTIISQNRDASASRASQTSDDPKQNLSQVISSIQKTLGLIHQLSLTVSSFNAASQLPLLQRLYAPPLFPPKP